MLTVVLWLTVWLAEAAMSPGHTSLCDLGACTCTRGRLQCDCSRSPLKEVILDRWVTPDYLTTSISVANCNHVHVSSVSGLPALHQVSLTNIANLTLEEHSFSWTTDDSRHSGLAIDISHSLIPEIPSYTFRGCLKDVLLTDLNVSVTRPYAFSAIDNMNKLQFIRVHFNDLANQTFKKFSTNFFMFIDSYINVLPTRTTVNVYVHKEARFQNITVNKMESKSLILNGVQSFKLSKSYIGHVAQNAFLLQTKGEVSITDNTFNYVDREAFLGITVDSRYLRDAGTQDLVFENNTLVTTESAALRFNATGFDIRLDWIRLKQPCSCELVDTWSTDLVSYHTNSTMTPSVSTITYCLSTTWSRLADYRANNCDDVRFSMVTEVAVTIAVIITGVAAAAAVIYCTVKNRGKRYINVPLQPLRPAQPHRGHILVVPDGKTYQETELHVIVDHLEPITSTEYIKDTT